MCIGREGESREAREATIRRSRDEGLPSVDPSLSGGQVREPPIIGGKDNILLTLSPGEGRPRSKLNKFVHTGNRTRRIRPRLTRVGAVVLAPFQECSVGAGRDNGADIALGESRVRPKVTTSETKEEPKCEIPRERMGSSRDGGGRAQEREGCTVDRSPHRNRERAVKEKVTEGLRNTAGKKTAAEEAVSMPRPAAVTNMVSVVDDPEQRVSGRHGHEGTMEETSEPRGGVVSH